MLCRLATAESHHGPRPAASSPGYAAKKPQLQLFFQPTRIQVILPNPPLLPRLLDPDPRLPHAHFLRRDSKKLCQAILSYSNKIAENDAAMEAIWRYPKPRNCRERGKDASFFRF
ncbi:hypothetical protein ACFX15_018010 [Malus domestica]